MCHLDLKHKVYSDPKTISYKHTGPSPGPIDKKTMTYPLSFTQSSLP